MHSRECRKMESCDDGSGGSAQLPAAAVVVVVVVIIIIIIRPRVSPISRQLLSLFLFRSQHAFAGCAQKDCETIRAQNEVGQQPACLWTPRGCCCFGKESKQMPARAGSLLAYGGGDCALAPGETLSMVRLVRAGHMPAAAAAAATSSQLACLSLITE